MASSGEPWSRCQMSSEVGLFLTMDCPNASPKKSSKHVSVGASCLTNLASVPVVVVVVVKAMELESGSCDRQWWQACIDGDGSGDRQVW